MKAYSHEARETNSPWDLGGAGVKNGMDLQSTDGEVIKRKENSLREDASTPEQFLRQYKSA